MVSANDARRAREVAARTCVALLVSASLIALAAPARAYVVKRTASGRAVHWEASRLEVEVAPDLVPGLGGGAVRRATRRAGQAWGGHGAPELYVTDDAPAAQYRAGEPGVQIVARTPWPHDRRFLALTVTQYDDRSGRLLDADVLLNRGQPIGEGADAYDLQTVLTHELGHVLGLEETDAPRATMWPLIPLGASHQRTLAEDDIRGIRALYAAPASASALGCARASVAPAGTPWSWLIFAAALLLIGARDPRTRRFALVGALLLLVIPAASAAPCPDGEVTFDAAFAGATALGPAAVVGVHVGDDGLFRTEVEVDGARVEVLGGCLDGVCQQVGPDAPPRAGESLLVAPATGAWARVDGDVARGGWLGEGRRLRVQR